MNTATTHNSPPPATPAPARRATRRAAGHSSLPAAIGACAALAGAALSGGCYRRVIYAHGLGSENVQVEQPYQQNTQVDNWIFGDLPPVRSSHP